MPREDGDKLNDKYLETQFGGKCKWEVRLNYA